MKNHPFIEAICVRLDDELFNVISFTQDALAPGGLPIRVRRSRDKYRRIEPPFARKQVPHAKPLNGHPESVAVATLGLAKTVEALGLVAPMALVDLDMPSSQPEGSQPHTTQLLIQLKNHDH